MQSSKIYIAKNRDRRDFVMKTPINLNNKTILVTGSPGFIGANLVIRLLQTLASGTVVSLDNINDYYEVSLKEWNGGWNRLTPLLPLPQ